VCLNSLFECLQVDAAKNSVASGSRISPYTKSYLEGADDGVSGEDMGISSVAKQSQQSPASVDKPVRPAADEKAHNSGRVLPMTSMEQGLPADSPYIPLPVAGSDLPISPYSCIEQTANSNAVTAESSLQADASVRPQNAVIGAEGMKCDGYVPWSSAQPSV